MDFRARVTVAELEEVMQTQPEHFAWGRELEASHSAAHRTIALDQFNIDTESGLPQSCILCKVIKYEKEKRENRGIRT